MPLVLPDDLARNWLTKPEDTLKEYQQESIELNAWTVRRLRGHQYRGNVEEAWEECHYQELNDQQELF